MAKKKTEESEALAVSENGRSQIDRDKSMQRLGAAWYAGHIHNQTKSDLVRFCQTVRDEKSFLDYGFPNFDGWLDSPMSPFPRTTFYREEKLFLSEGTDNYDLYNELGVPARVRQQLPPGEVEVDGDEVVIGGDTRYPLGDPAIKNVITQLVKDKLEAEQRVVAAAEEILGLTEIKGKYKTLCAEVDEANEKPPYVTAYLNTVEALLTFVAEVDELPDEMKANRAENDLDHIGELMNQLSRAYGEGDFTAKRRSAAGAR